MPKNLSPDDFTATLLDTIPVGKVGWNGDDHYALIDKIVSEVGRRIDEASPMVDARLPDGSRVNAVIHPLAIGGPFLTIRKFSKTPLSIEKRIRNKNVFEQQLPGAQQDLMRGCLRFGIGIATGRKSVDAHTLGFAIEKILSSARGHVRPRSEELLRVAALLSPTCLQQNKGAPGDQRFMPAQVIRVDGMRRGQAAEIKRCACAVEMTQREFMNCGKMGQKVKRCIYVRSRMGHEIAPLYGGSINHSQLLISD